MNVLLKSLSAFAVMGLLVPITASAAVAPKAQLAGSPQLYAVRGDLGLGRPTRYVTFKTVRGISARSLVVTVSGSSGRTYNADDNSRDSSRKCFRSAMQPYQRTPPPRRLKPGVAYKVRFYTRPSLNGERAWFATRILHAHSFFPRTSASGGQSAPSPCASDASTSSPFTIRVSNSGLGGDPGYFYVGGPINVTVTGRAPAPTFQVCMTPLPIDRASCRSGRVGRTVETLGAPSKSGLTTLRVSFGPNKVYLRQIHVRKAT